MTVSANLPPREIRFRWMTEKNEKREAEEAEVERLREGGNEVVSIGWSSPGGSKTIEHEAGPEPSSKG
jgi:hypothetical protein